jgi:hypothetical protein
VNDSGFSASLSFDQSGTYTVVHYYCIQIILNFNPYFPDLIATFRSLKVYLLGVIPLCPARGRWAKKTLSKVLSGGTVRREFDQSFPTERLLL